MKHPCYSPRFGKNRLILLGHSVSFRDAGKRVTGKVIQIGLGEVDPNWIEVLADSKFDEFSPFCLSPKDLTPLENSVCEPYLNGSPRTKETI